MPPGPSSDPPPPPDDGVEVGAEVEPRGLLGSLVTVGRTSSEPASSSPPPRPESEVGSLLAGAEVSAPVGVSVFSSSSPASEDATSDPLTPAAGAGSSALTSQRPARAAIVRA